MVSNVSKYLMMGLIAIPLVSSASVVTDSNGTIANLQSSETNTTQPLLSNENNVPLKTTVKEAIESNYRIKQARERVQQANHFIREAYADFLPQVALTGNTQRKQYEGFDNQNYSQSQYDMAVTYNLFSSGKDFATVQKNKILKKTQEEKLKGTLEEEIAKVIDAYFSVVYGKLSLEVNQKNYDKLVKIYDIVKTKRELGAATMGDESSISASVSNAKTAMTNTESAYNNAKDYYEFLTNKKAAEYTPYETGFEIKLDDINRVLDEVQSNNTDLSIIKTQISSKQKEIFINKATDWPKIDLSLIDTRRNRYDYNSHNATIPVDGYNSDLFVQLSFNYTLYTGGKTEARTARLMSESSEAAYNLEYTAKELKWNSQKLYNSVQTNTNTLETLSSEIAASEKMADAYWERFRLSSQDLVTLLQAQRQVNTAELEKLKSEKTRILDYFNLLAKQGKLLEYFGY